jgi:hypothetical protein
MEVSWSNRVRGTVESQGKSNFLHLIERRKTNSTAHVGRRNWLLKHVFWRKIEKNIKNEKMRRKKT